MDKDLGRIVLDELTKDEALLRNYIRTRLERGQDIPATLMRAVDFFSQAKPEQVEIPHTFDELDRRDDQERRVLLTRLENEGRSPRFNYEDYRAKQREQQDESEQA